MTKVDRERFFEQSRPYRDQIVAIQRKLGITSFTKDAQFWTLGGPNHYEYQYLREYLGFGQGSYHTVDRGKMAPKIDESMVTYSNTEFDYRLSDQWVNPVVISYDSTELMTPPKNNEDRRQDWKFHNLCDIVEIALDSADEIIVHSNWMVGYASTRSLKRVYDVELLKREYGRWAGYVESRFKKAKFFNGLTDRMVGSSTDMISLHFSVQR